MTKSKITCPNEKKIIAYALSRGVKSPRLKYEGLFGWSLYGGGKDEQDWPLTWGVARECDIMTGCGNTEFHQVWPEKFKLPESKNAD